jgi:GMP synthase (glutamine-hydrolysing)
MMGRAVKPFLILQLRPETEASDDEYSAILRKGGLATDQTRRIRLDRDTLPDIDLSDYAGTIVGGGPGCVSDAQRDKTTTDARAEAACLSLMPQITAADLPFMGCCYGIGILAHHLGATVSKERYGEAVSAATCTGRQTANATRCWTVFPTSSMRLSATKRPCKTSPPMPLTCCPAMFARFR